MEPVLAGLLADDRIPLPGHAGKPCHPAPGLVFGNLHRLSQLDEAGTAPPVVGEESEHQGQGPQFFRRQDVPQSAGPQPRRKDEAGGGPEGAAGADIPPEQFCDEGGFRRSGR